MQSDRQGIILDNVAQASAELVAVLRETAERLARDASYQWGHMGMCNCGHLAQSITGLPGAEIHDYALSREGDWERQAEDYCPTSGLLIDSVLASMFALGLTRDDVRHLERLSDPAITRRAGRGLRFNRRDDVVAYLSAWAGSLEDQIHPFARATGTNASAAPMINTSQTFAKK